MTTETPSHLRPPSRHTETWKIPGVIRLEGDARDPRKTRLLDDETGEELKLGLKSIQFTASVDHPNSIVMEVADVAVRAASHHNHIDISSEDLWTLAKMNGFTISSVPAYPARMVSYGPAELQITFRDFPDLVVTHGNVRKLEAIEHAELKLHDHLKGLAEDKYARPAPSEELEGEFMIWAHGPMPEEFES